MPKWKNILKGFFDAHESSAVFIVTGSAKLDIFRKSGDSLAGRYFSFRINPLMLSEYAGNKIESVMPETDPFAMVKKLLSSKEQRAKFEEMMGFGPFPEPLIKGDTLFASKWHDSYIERIIREDMRDLTMVQELEKVVDLVHMLPHRVCSPLSYNSLREDLEMNHATVKKYISHLAAMYAVFLLPPYTAKITRPVKKEKKAYFYDYAFIKDEAAKFENFTAMELLSRVDLWNDATKDKYALYFVRNREGKETDFLITKNSVPYMLVEAKLNETVIESHHRTTAEKLGNIPYVQVVAKENIFRSEEGKFTVVSASRFFA
jgi:predicted AAA+ superfamily ATPase